MESAAEKRLTAQPQAEGVEARLHRVGEELQRCIRGVINALPDGDAKPARLARELGVDKVLTSRVINAIRHEEPLATLSESPGPAPLRRLLAAARKKGVPEKYLEAAANAIAQFQSLIEHEIGSRSALDTILSVWLPETRAEFELRRKQAAFRAMSELLGAAAEVFFDTIIHYPSDDGVNLDYVMLSGLLGLRRLRPGSAVNLSTMKLPLQNPPSTARVPCTLDGVPITSKRSAVLEEFCTSPVANLKAQRSGDFVHYLLEEQDFGINASSDLIIAEFNPAVLPHYYEDKRHAAGGDVHLPARVYIVDALLYEGVLPGSTPTLFQYLPGARGLASVDDRSRDVDRLDLRETITALGNGLSAFRTADIPKYVPMLQHICDKLGWDGSRFRGYRCRIDYPILKSEVAMAFDARPPRESKEP